MDSSSVYPASISSTGQIQQISITSATYGPQALLQPQSQSQAQSQPLSYLAADESSYRNVFAQDFAKQSALQISAAQAPKTSNTMQSVPSTSQPQQASTSQPQQASTSQPQQSSVLKLP